MAGLLYYVPGHSGQMTSGDACKLGLAHAFGHLKDEGLRCNGVYNNGPDVKDGGSGAGTVIADPSFAGKLGVYLDRQAWRKVPGSSAYVGYYTDDPPKPQDLLRSQVIPGRVVLLGDDQQWMAPIARGVLGSEDELVYHCPLPTATTIGDDGEWGRGSIMPKYLPLWEAATRVWNAISAECLAAPGNSDTERDVSIDCAGGNDAAMLAIATNYRVGKAEVALLGLFNSQAVSGILLTLVDWQTIASWTEKKTATGGSSTGGGQADDTPATGPR